MGELVLRKAVDKLMDITTKIDNIIDECMPIVVSQQKNIAEALILAKGMKELKEIFYKNEAIKSTIESMQDSKLGFMTDRSVEAISRNPKLMRYTYKQVADCCIEALLRGYRLTGKEFYILVGNFYPGQAGKYRHIIEYPGLSNFNFTNSPAVFKTETRIVKNRSEKIIYAEVKCWAKWKLNSKIFTIGVDKTDELLFKVKVNNNMGDDGIIGKALSKLFGRVLSRITGNMLPEASEETEIIDIEPDTNSDNEDIENKIKEPIVRKTPDITDINSCLIVEEDPDALLRMVQFFASFDVSDIVMSQLVGFESVDTLTVEGFGKLRKIQRYYNENPKKFDELKTQLKVEPISSDEMKNKFELLYRDIVEKIA